ncbi:MAG TPA: DNA recombination protein RmuC [Bacillota bacterium]
MLEINGWVGFGLGVAAGIAIAKWAGWSKTANLKELAAQLAVQSQTERIKDLETMMERMKEAFAALSYEALTKNSDQLLNLANQALKQQNQLGEQTLEAKKELIDQTLAQMSKELTKVQEMVNGLEKDREQKFGELSNQLRAAAEATGRLQETTNNLYAILANTRIRGQWGERMAEDVLRLSGLVEGINYRKQQWSGAGSRPDFTFYMPKDLKVNMDVKFPLDNYLNYIQAEDPAARENYKQQFLKDVRNRIKEVTGRDYINPEDRTVDYVLVFIPNEQIYSFINEVDGMLLDEALRNRVVLCSPLTLYAFLAVIRQAVESYNLEQTTTRVLALLGSFYKQWEAFCTAMERMGRRLSDAQKEYANLMATRRNQLEKPLQALEELRRQNSLPVTEAEVAVTQDETGPEISTSE